ncbi:MAG: phosphotransferase, partial [Sciscionella sp.]
MAIPPGGRFGRERLATVLAEVCARAGLDHRRAELIRFTNNAVFALAGAPVVVRIVASRSLRHRVAKVVTIARWLAEQQIPAVRLWPGLEQPVRVGEDVVTVWRRVPEVRRSASPKDLALLLLRLHELPSPPFEIPRWAPLDDVRCRLTDAEELTPEDREFLEQRCAELQCELDELRFRHGERLVHGDAHLGNVIVG